MVFSDFLGVGKVRLYDLFRPTCDLPLSTDFVVSD